MGLCWPWALMGADHILIAAKSFSHFAFNMNTIVDGTFVSIGEVPRTYLLDYLAIRLPEVFLIGILSMVIIVLISLPRNFKTLKPFFQNRLPQISLAIAILFPLFFVLYDRPALYNGVRHFTFIIPPLAVLAGIGLSQAWDKLSQHPKWQLSFAIAATALALNTAYILFELKPYEYVYYNHFAGKNLKQAEHHWEADYWSSSLIDASKMLENYLDAEQKKWPSEHQGSYYVAVCAEAFQGRAYLDKRFNITENWVRADFFISSTHMNCDKVLNGNIIGTVERLGAPLAVVKDRRDLIGEDRRPHAAPQD